VETTPALAHFLGVSALMFTCGAYCVLARRNSISILMGVELILNAANLNLVSFATFLHAKTFYEGHCFAIFVIVLAASEAAVFLALLLSIYQHMDRIDVDGVQTLKG
jgi:NADH-quinone oxidoreductase subunit K